MKILEIEPTDDFVYGSYFKPETDDQASKSNGNKYYNKLSGINIDTNIDYYSNFATISTQKVLGLNNKSIQSSTAGKTKYSYIHYENQDWKDWKEYYYSMIPGFIGSGKTSGGNFAQYDLMTDVKIETMPVWKFNSKTTDINAEYDIVVVGATQNYKNGQLKRIYSYKNNGRYWVDSKMAGASNDISFKRYISYNDNNLQSFDFSQFRNDNSPEAPSHDTYGDPSYALAWTAVGDIVDTIKGSYQWGSTNDYWYSYNGNDERYVKSKTISYTIPNGTINSIVTNKNVTINSQGGSDASQAGTRYEARDLTKKKAELLLDFADRNLLIMDDAVYKADGSVDGSLIDSRSEMYYVANTVNAAGSSVKNIHSDSSLKDNAGLNKVRKESLLDQCEIDPVLKADGTKKDWPVEYSYSRIDLSDATHNEQKVNGENGLTFTLTVGGRKYNDDGSLKKYYANAYADVNNNSVYDGSLMEQRKTLAFSYNDNNHNGIYDDGDTLPTETVTDSAGNSSSKAVEPDIESGSEKLSTFFVFDITDPNNRMEVSSTRSYPYNAMYPGRTYSVQAALAGDYTGAVGYTLELSQGESARDFASSNRDTSVGFTRFQPKNGKKVIHVLQMNPDPDMTQNQSSNRSNTMPFYDRGSTEGQKFLSEMNKVQDFAVEIDFLQNNTNGKGFYDYDKAGWTQYASYQGRYIKLYKSTAYPNEEWPRVQNPNSTGTADMYKFNMANQAEFTAFLENYDMLFLAGRDCSSVSNDPKFIKSLNAYSANGGSIIMSHDMIGSVYSNNSTFSGNRGIYSSKWKMSGPLNQYLLETYYFRKLGGQVEKYYTPGTTSYSYNSIKATSDRSSSTMMPLEKSFLLAANKWENANMLTANNMRFPDEYDIRNSADYLQLVVGDYLGDSQDNLVDGENKPGILYSNPWQTWQNPLWFSSTYPTNDGNKYDDGSVNAGHVGANVQYLASCVSNNDLYNLQHYSRDYSDIATGAVNSLGLYPSGGSSDLIYGREFPWNRTTNTIKNVNKGKVSSYPFDLIAVQKQRGKGNFENGNVNVASTHVQQYRLDLDHTNDPAPSMPGKMTNITDDTIVWYDLSGSTIYDWMDGDAANNYYIYTKGNITYTGVGHSQVGNGQNEIDLFINTMIASYRPAESSPYIRVTNTDASATSTNETVVYLDESAGGNGVVTFQVMDPTLANINRDYYLKVYEVQADGTERLATDGTITTNPSAENVLKVYNNATVDPTNEVEKETDGVRKRQLGLLQNGGNDTDANQTRVNTLVSGEYGFEYKVEKGGNYCFQGLKDHKYCIHLCYRNYKTNTSTNSTTFGSFKEVQHFVKLQNLGYFELY